jgi:ankyrin repeat protein
MSLHEAAVSGNLDAVKSLIEGNANVDELNDSGLTPLIAVAQSAGPTPPFKSIMIMEYLVKTGKANVNFRGPQGTVVDILNQVVENKNDPLVCNLFGVLGSPKKDNTPSPRRVERTEELKKILNMHIPDARKPVPYREDTSRPQTPPPSAEVLKLRAENQALRKEIDRLRDIVNKMNPQEQLKTMYARLVQLEAIESGLNNLTL